MGNDFASVFSSVQGDITQSECDTIMAGCNPAHSSTLEHAVANAAGAQWAQELEEDMKGRRPGDAWIMGAGDLPFKGIYMCMTPVWDGNIWNEERFLIACYRNILSIFEGDNIAVPLLATGNHRFPDARAVRLAVQTSMEHKPDHISRIIFTAIDPEIASLTATRLARELGRL